MNTGPGQIQRLLQSRAKQPGFLRYDVPIYYVSEELFAAALRTELPDDIVVEAIPFPFDALVFMLPKGTLRHPTDGDCPFLVLSRTSKDQSYSLRIPGLDFSVTARQDAVLVSTYMPETEFSRTIRWPLSRPDVTDRFGVDLAQPAQEATACKMIGGNIPILS